MSADICLILEGTYPYVRGGVSAWTHELIRQHPEFRFHLVCLLPPNQEEPKPYYELPENVIGLTPIVLQHLPFGTVASDRTAERMADALYGPLKRLTTGIADVADLSALMEIIHRHKSHANRQTLMESEAAWSLITRLYEEDFAENSMLDYFWSWRGLVGSLYSLLLAKLPDAKVYHALSTGYAGMMLARAKIETGRPCVLTEHGIYTNERRVEIGLASWLTETSSHALTIDRTRLSLRDLWIDTFTNYSRITYNAADQLITLYAGNQHAQMLDGAPVEKMRLIPNGVDIERFGALPRQESDRPTIALIGRVVPIKDVKTYLRCVALLRDMLPDIHAYIIGPTDEDAEYADECKAMVEYLALTDNVTFTGQVRIDDYLPQIDVVVFSSLSEAQPLVILEAGAAGIPVVATDVGACADLILGDAREHPVLGVGGAVVPLGSPQALARATYRLLTDRGARSRAGAILRERVHNYYNKADQVAAYRSLYASLLNG